MNDQPGLRTARLAVVATFFAHGALFANWVSVIPAIAAKLQLQPAALGIGLVGGAVGAVLALLASGFLVARLGSRLATTVGGLVFCAALPLPLFAPSLAGLFLALFLFGAASSTTDVAMNTQAVDVERAYRRPIMSSFHGMWSLGGLAGALASGAVAGVGVAPVPHLVGASILLAGVMIVAAFNLLPSPPRPIPVAGLVGSLTSNLLVLGLIAACLLIAEGSAADWSALYLRNTLRVGPGFATSAFAGFSLAMAVGRLLGDRLVHRYGPVRVLRGGAVLLIVGFGGALLSSVPAIAIAGYVCLGAGLANGVPIVFSASGRSASAIPSAGISTVATLGYLGFVAGPPVIGAAAQLTTLRVALGLIPLLGLVVLALASSAVLRPGPFPSGTPE